MTSSQHEIEDILHAAPKPTPPAGLKERLIAQVRLPEARTAASYSASPPRATRWLRRWWPVLAPATVSLACAVGLTVQQVEIRDLKQTIRDLPGEFMTKPGALSTPAAQSSTTAAQAEAAIKTQQEIDRLKALAAQLAAEIAQLEQLQAENGKLRAQLAAPPPGLLSAEETEALAKARERAECIACVNNLKQFGLAVRTWAIDNADVNPPDIICMSNELSVPKILVCPADTGRVAAKDWNSFSAANCSYEYLAPSAPETEPLRVMARCPIHGNIALCDGSVQRELAKRHPEQLVQRDGKLFFVEPAQPPRGTPPAQGDNPPSGGSNP